MAAGMVSGGRMLPVFFKPGVAVANNAQSGETMKSFYECAAAGQRMLAR